MDECETWGPLCNGQREMGVWFYRDTEILSEVGQRFMVKAYHDVLPREGFEPVGEPHLHVFPVTEDFANVLAHGLARKVAI